MSCSPAPTPSWVTPASLQRRRPLYFSQLDRARGGTSLLPQSCWKSEGGGWGPRGGPQGRCGLEGPCPLPISHVPPLLMRGTLMRPDCIPLHFLSSKCMDLGARKEQVQKEHHLKGTFIVQQLQGQSPSFPAGLPGPWRPHLLADAAPRCPFHSPCCPSLSASLGQITVCLSSWLGQAARAEAGAAWLHSPRGPSSGSGPCRAGFFWACI